MKEMKMAQNQKLLELFDRVERAGVRVNRAALERKFNFTVSGIKTEGIDLCIFFRLGELVTSLAEQEDFVCELGGIVVFPIICDPLIYTRDDFLTHKRKSSGYFVGRNIAINVWKKARKAKRLALASEMFKSSVQVVPDRHLSLANKEKLFAFIDSALEFHRSETHS